MLTKIIKFGLILIVCLNFLSSNAYDTDSNYYQITIGTTLVQKLFNPIDEQELLIKYNLIGSSFPVPLIQINFQTNRFCSNNDLLSIYNKTFFHLSYSLNKYYHHLAALDYGLEDFLCSFFGIAAKVGINYSWTDTRFEDKNTYGYYNFTNSGIGLNGGAKMIIKLNSKKMKQDAAYNVDFILEGGIDLYSPNLFTFSGDYANGLRSEDIQIEKIDYSFPYGYFPYLNLGFRF